MNTQDLNAFELDGPTIPYGTVVVTPGAAVLEFVGGQPAVSVGSLAPIVVSPGAATLTFVGGQPVVLLTALPTAPDVQPAAGIWLVEVEAAVSEGQVSEEMNTFELNGPTLQDVHTTLRYTDSGSGYATLPDDTPADIGYDNCLSQPGYIDRSLTVGAARVGYGEVLLVSTGHLDGLLSLGFDGQTLLIRRGPQDGHYPADFPVQMRASVKQPEFTSTRVRFLLRDRLVELDKPLLQAYYGGTNVLPNGVDGTADDLQGKPKPKVWGSCYNISPVLVNTSRLIYQAHDGALADLPAVYDRGAALTRGADYADLADMQASAPSAGQFRAWLAGGCLRLGASPSGQVTCDAVEGATAAQRTTAQILTRMAQAMGVAEDDLDAIDRVTLDANAPYEVGVWVNGPDTALAMMDKVATSVGAWYGFDRLGYFRMGRLSVPAGTPVAEITDASIVNLERSAQDDLPSWRVQVNYGINGTVQDSDIAGSVPADRRAWIAQASRSAEASRASVKTMHKLAGEMVRDTCLVTAADAQAEAGRLLGLYSVRRDTFVATVRLGAEEVGALDLGRVVRITWPRFGLGAGRLMVLVGMKLDFRALEATLTLWG